MAVKTITVGELRRLLAGLPDDAGVLLLDAPGGACPIESVDPESVMDQDGVNFLLLEFQTDDDIWFGFDEIGKLDTTG